MITVTKFGPVYRVKATPPEVPKTWSSLMPAERVRRKWSRFRRPTRSQLKNPALFPKEKGLGAREVVEELIRHGASLHDAYEAMFEADPLRAARELR